MSDAYEFDIACEFPEKPGEPKKALLRLYVTSKKASRQQVQEVAKALTCGAASPRLHSTGDETMARDRGGHPGGAGGGASGWLRRGQA